MRKNRYKLPMKKAWEIQKQLTGNTDKIMSYTELANIAADKIGWPQIEKGQPKERDFAKQYLIRYSQMLTVPTSSASWVYFIKSGPWIKIGVSDNVDARLASLQTANPVKLELLAKIGCASKSEAFAIEKKLHSSLRSYRAEGEWFFGRAISVIGDYCTGIEWMGDDIAEKAMIRRVEGAKTKPKSQWSNK